MGIYVILSVAKDLKELLPACSGPAAVEMYQRSVPVQTVAFRATNKATCPYISRGGEDLNSYQTLFLPAVNCLLRPVPATFKCVKYVYEPLM